MGVTENWQWTPGPVLGIETSCDETAAAIVAPDKRILSNVVLSQIDEHTPYGGVVPEIAARAHIEHLDRLIARALKEARLGFGDLAAIAATAGPGLIGGVIVGLMTGKALASAHQLPFAAINHLEAHALSARLLDEVGFPYLLLLVSGGHCQLVRVEGVGAYQRLGTTIDDAVGEAFDKAAKLLGLGYPGGPKVEQAAKTGDASRFDLPRPLLGRAGCDFSFSGLKTALRREAEKLKAGHALDDQAVADLCASLQAAIGDVLVDRTSNAMDAFLEREKDSAGPRAWEEGDRPNAPGMGRFPGREMSQTAGPASTDRAPGTKSPALVLAGGVAANGNLRSRLHALVGERDFRLVCPPPELCTDNAAMIAWAGIERLALGWADPVSVPARARWPLDPDAPPAIGAGVKA